MLTKKEEQMLRKYYSRAVTSLSYLTVALVIGGFWILLEMIGDIALNSPESNDLALYTYLGIVVVYMAVFLYQLISVRVGMRGKKWGTLVEKANTAVSQKDYSVQASAAVGLAALGRLMGRSDDNRISGAGQAAQVAGGIAAGITVFGMMFEARANIKKVAQALEIKLPSAKRQILTIVGIPVLLLAGVTAPHYMRAIEYTSQAKQNASATVVKVAQALQDVCGYVYYEDPMEQFRDYGYTVRGYVRDIDEKNNSYMAVEVDNEGFICETSYVFEADLSRTEEENLDQAQEDFALLNSGLKKAEAPVRSENLLWGDLIQDDFRELFREKGYYEEFRLDYEDLGMNVSFDTDPEEEYDEYSQSRIYVYLREMD